MSHLISLFYGKPSLHLSALRARGLELDRLFEVSFDSAQEQFETWHAPTAPLEAEQGAVGAAAELGEGKDALNARQFAELCLNEE
jgi:hypothetical protein